MRQKDKLTIRSIDYRWQEPNAWELIASNLLHCCLKDGFPGTPRLIFALGEYETMAAFLVTRIAQNGGIIQAIFGWDLLSYIFYCNSRNRDLRFHGHLLNQVLSPSCRCMGITPFSFRVRVEFILPSEWDAGSFPANYRVSSCVSSSFCLYFYD